MRRIALTALALALVAVASAGTHPTDAPPQRTPEAAMEATTAVFYSHDFGWRASRERHAQWPLRAMRVRRAWQHSRGRGVVVAVVDSGVGPTPELTGQLVPGVNLGAKPPRRIDLFDHGTAVSSIIAARRDGHGIVGIAPAAKVMSVRIFDDWSAPARRLVRGIRWAVDHHADVVNLSLVERNMPALRSAIRYATEHGVVVVAGAGNDRQSGSPVHYPAAYPGVIAVGAVRADLALAGYSNEGGYVDVVAPGSRVLAADPFGTLSWYWGTSFATPQVSGVVALMLAANPRLTPAEVQRILRSTAEDLGAPGKDRLYGAGLVEAPAAVRAALALR